MPLLYLLLLGTLLLPLALQAQSAVLDELLSDKKIVWAQVVEVDIDLNPVVQTGSNDPQPPLLAKNKERHLFYYRAEDAGLKYPKAPLAYLWSHAFYKYRLDSSFHYYQSAALQDPIQGQARYEHWVLRDTLIDFRPDDPNYKPTMLEQPRVKLSEMRFMRLRQVLYYRKGEPMLQSWVLAVAFLRAVYDSNGQFIAYVPHFWIPAKPVQSLEALQQPGVRIIQKSYSDQPLEGGSVGLLEQYPKAVVEKYSRALVHEKIWQHFLESKLQGAKYHDSYFDPISSANHRDAVLRTLPQMPTAANWSGLRFIRHWAWDAQNKSLLYHDVGLAPLYVGLREALPELQEAFFYYRYP